MPYTKLELFLSLLFQFVIGCLTAYYAKRQGRNPYLWFMIGFLFGIFAPLVLFYLSFIKNTGDTNGMPGMTVSNPDPELEKSPELHSKDEQKLREEEEKLWFYLDQSHQQMGPVSIIALRELWNRGQLGLNTYVWTEGMQEWQKVDVLVDLKAILSRT